MFFIVSFPNSTFRNFEMMQSLLIIIFYVIDLVLTIITLTWLQNLFGSFFNVRVMT